MITAVDTSIMLDIFVADPHFLESSKALLRQALAEGKAVVCPVVWAEGRCFFRNNSAYDESMSGLNLTYDDFTPEVSSKAGVLWEEYRRHKGPRTRIVSDFLIGAHAKLKADRLLTRDRGFYRSYFRDLVLLEKMPNP